MFASQFQSRVCFQTMKFTLLVFLSFISVVVSSPLCDGGGQLPSNTSSTGCIPCPSGSACPAGVTSNLSTSLCALGYYNPLESQTACMPCPAGTYCPTRGGTSFIQCDASSDTPEGSSACAFCNSKDYFINPTTGVCTLKTKCDSKTQYELVGNASTTNNTQDRTCVSLTPFTPEPATEPGKNTSPWCVSGGTKKLQCTNVLKKYIIKASTPTSDIVVETWSPCKSNQYVFQKAISDAEGFLIQQQICKNYTVCPASSFMFIQGDLTEDQDNVCGRLTECVPGKTYQLSPPGIDPSTGMGTDRVCAPCITCSPQSEYLFKSCNSTHPGVCVPKKDCSNPPGIAYQVSGAVDSPGDGSFGSDTVCANYTKCPPGMYANYSGDAVSDRRCSPCPLGTYSPDYGIQCTACPKDTFASTEGSVSCNSCTNCISPTGNVIPTIDSGWGDCPIGVNISIQQSSNQSKCILAYRTLCTTSQDSTCMACSTPEWSLDRSTGLCSPCGRGYHYARPYYQGNLSESRRCLPCTKNYYCQGSDTFRPCQDLIIWKDNRSTSGFFSSPESSIASSFPSDCSCSGSYGGFQGKANGIMGCTPCPSGSYSNSSTGGRCLPCPEGHYSMQAEVENLFTCPAANMNWGFLDGYPAPERSITSEYQGQGCMATIGAASCTQCPADRPHTHGTGSSSISDCRVCPEGHFRGSGGSTTCTPCRAPCSEAVEYEVRKHTKKVATKKISSTSSRKS